MKIQKWHQIILPLFICFVGLSVNGYASSLLVAKPEMSLLIVDGVNQNFSSYNIGGNYFFKLRDLAQAVNGTAKQFNVTWNNDKNAIDMYSGQPYDVEVGSAQEPDIQDKAAELSNVSIYVNGKVGQFTAYNIDGNNYFKLRDIMETFNVGVGWNEELSAIELNTEQNYLSQQPKPQPEPSAFQELTAKEIYSKCSKAVFYIETYDIKGEELGTGSGFFINTTGQAVTNFHVIEGAFSARITTTDQQSYDVLSVADFDIDKDVAVLNINGDNFESLEIGDSNMVEGGEPIFAIGSPLGLSNTITEGVVSNPNRLLEGQRCIQISAALSSGSSGGALLNTSGQVIGITQSGMVKGQNLNFAVPIETVSALNLEQTPKSLQRVAALYEEYWYEAKPGVMDVIVEEDEPNNLPYTADYIASGDTVIGTIEPKDEDFFWTVVNTPGTMDIICFSDSEDFEYLGMYLSDTELKNGQQGDILILEDGSKCLAGRYKIENPGYYSVWLTPLKDNITVDYTFYYEFTPEVSK